MLHHLYVSNKKRTAVSSWHLNNGINIRHHNLAFKLAFGHSQCRRTCWTRFEHEQERTLQPCLPFKSCRSVVRLCGTAFSSSQTAHLPTRVGLTPAGDSQRASQLTDGGRECKRAKAAGGRIYMRQRCKPSCNQCTGSNRAWGIWSIFLPALKNIAF